MHMGIRLCMQRLPSLKKSYKLHENGSKNQKKMILYM